MPDGKHPVFANADLACGDDNVDQIDDVPDDASDTSDKSKQTATSQASTSQQAGKVSRPVISLVTMCSPLH